MAETTELLTTREVADLLRVHPKQVYRLLPRGLPARRVGGEWRFSPEEVLLWSGASGRAGAPDPAPVAAKPSPPAPLLAGNGDVVVELLLRNIRGSPAVGLVPADHGSGFEMLQRKEVVATGSHGPPGSSADEERLVFIHLVDRKIGLAVRHGVKFAHLRGLRHLRVASRPTTAGTRQRFDVELRRSGLDPGAVHGRAALLASHLDVVCAVARGDADVGLASAAWAQKTGLAFRPLFTEAYGLLLRASDLGDSRVVRLCEAAQTTSFRRQLADVAGYDTEKTGAILYGGKEDDPAEDVASARGGAPKRGAR